jgi:hypothetical protein
VLKKPLDGPATRLVAAELNVAKRPLSAMNENRPGALPGVPPEPAFRRVVAPFARLRRKTLQHRPLGWSDVRLVAFEVNVTSCPSPEMLGMPLGPLAS